MRYLGVDLAWVEHARGRSANASGVVALDPSGDVVDAGWTVGLDQTIDWIEGSSTEDCTLFVDAPLEPACDDHRAGPTRATPRVIQCAGERRRERAAIARRVL